MTETVLLARLKTLQHILEEMKALLAWQQLKTTETRQRPSTSIRFNNTTQQDLLDKYSLFHSISMRIRSILDDSNTNITRKQRACIKSQLTKFELQAYYLGSPIRIY